MTDIMINILYMTVYVFGGLFLSFIAGVLIYDRQLTKGYNLKEYLFEKDKKIVWLDFFGAYILPIFIVAKNTMSGEEAKTFLLDITTILVLMLITLVVISFGRMISSLLIKKIMKKFGEDTDLNKEIFLQNNYAALFFNFAVTAFIVNILLQEDLFGAKRVLLEFTVKGYIIGILTILVIAVYKIFELKKVKFFEVMFKNDNPAAGLNFFAYIFSWQIILYKISDFYNISEYYDVLTKSFKIKEFSFEILSAFLMILIFFEISKILVKRFIKKVMKEDIDDEIYIQKNVGAAFGMLVVYLGIAIMVTGVMFG